MYYIKFIGENIMAILSDFHTHSLFSSDSSAKPEEIINAAAAKGLASICFTEHNDYDYPPENGQVMFNLDFDGYYNYIDAMRSSALGALSADNKTYAADSSVCTNNSIYTDNNTCSDNGSLVSIYIGVEQGLSVPAADRINAYDPDKKLDFIIGSSHLVDGGDPYYPEFWNNRSTKAAILSYFESIYKNIQVCHNFDVYGHLDYVVRYAPNKDAFYNWLDYYDLLDSILKQLIQAGKGIEVNTSGLKSGLTYPNPCLGILKRYRELGGEILTIGSDAHEPKYVGYSFDTIPALLYEAGFRYYTTFSKRAPVFHRL